MVEGKPYVNFKIINERVATTVDTNYLWATTVEAKKGPVKVPVLCQDAGEVKKIFGVDLGAYFAQGAENLLVVRAVAETKAHQLKKSSASIYTAEDFIYKHVVLSKYTNGKTKQYVNVIATEGSSEEVTKVYVTSLNNNNNKYVACNPTTGEILAESQNTIYAPTDVIDEKTEETVTIPAGTSVITLTSKYYGDYDLSLVLYQNLATNGYNLTLTEAGNGYVSITNVTDLLNIVNRINDKNLNVVAELTEKGHEIVGVTRAIPQLSAEEDFSDVAVGQILARSESDTSKYKVSLVEIDNTFVFTGGSNGEWDEHAQRLPITYRAQAHKEALETLRSYRVCGIFCIYGDDVIQREYQLHGYDADNPDDGMNNDKNCKWRMILLGANDDDRNSALSLEAKAAALDNQYTLLLGQGLIEGGVQKMPYECTPYVAGLRAALPYQDSIFGGQKRKEIKGVNPNLSIAPLFSYEDNQDLVWEPAVYEALNEAGVLTFTYDYGRLTLTDGVTTRQSIAEEDEEGVISILKYAQNAIYDVCISYIGRNITSDTQASLEMEISGVLEAMVNADKSLINIDSEGLSAYEVDVVMNPRATQLVGKIYVYLKITPVHALRQIECEMTVQ